MNNFKINIIFQISVIGMACIMGVNAADDKENLSQFKKDVMADWNAKRHTCQSKEVAWIDKSDVVAAVEVIAREEVHPEKTAGRPDRSRSLGELITMRVDEVLFQRLKCETNQLVRIFIFKNWLDMSDPLVRPGDSGVVFLQEMSNPDLLTSKQPTWPQLPPDKYFDYATLPRLKNTEGARKAFIPSSQTNEINRFKRQIQCGLSNNMTTSIAKDQIPYVTIEYKSSIGKSFTNDSCVVITNVPAVK